MTRKDAPLSPVLARDFPEWQNLETQKWKLAPLLLKGNKLVLLVETSALAEDATYLHLLQNATACFLHNHDFQKYIHKGMGCQLSQIIANI